MKGKLRRIIAGFLAALTAITTVICNGQAAFAASPDGNITMWIASASQTGAMEELGNSHSDYMYYHMIDDNVAYCLNYGLMSQYGEYMTSDTDPMTELSVEQKRLLFFCMYFGHENTVTEYPGETAFDEYSETQGMIWSIVAGNFDSGLDDSVAEKLAACSHDSEYAYEYYVNLKNNIKNSYYMVSPSFADAYNFMAPTYELKWNADNKRYETTLEDTNGVLDNYDFIIDGYQVERNGNSITISSANVNTSVTGVTMDTNIGAVGLTGNCIYWNSGMEGYQEMIAEKPTADPVHAYFNVKTESIGYGDLVKTDKSTGKKLAGAVYGIYSNKDCTNLVQTMTTDENGYAKSSALIPGAYYVKETNAPNGYILDDTVYLMSVLAGQTTSVEAADMEQLGELEIFKEGEVLTGWNGSSFIYETKRLSGATFAVTAGEDIYRADGTLMYHKGDTVKDNLVSDHDGSVKLTGLFLGTYVVTETQSIAGYTIDSTPKIVILSYGNQNVEVQYESVTITNTRQKATVEVEKTDVDTKNPLGGAEFTIYADSDVKNDAGQVIVSKGASIQTVTSGTDGKAAFTVDLPIANSYLVKETKAPYGYVLDQSDVYKFSFDYMSQDTACAAFSHSYSDKRVTAKISLSKIDDENNTAVPQGDAKIADAVYGLYAREDIVHPDGTSGVMYRANDLIATMTTDQNGRAEIKGLYLGNYYVKEIKPSEGYLLDETEHDLICDYEGDRVAEITRSSVSKEHVKKQPFQLIKISVGDTDTEGELLSGAGFSVYLKSTIPMKDGKYDIFVSANDLYNTLKKCNSKYDIIFLDISMPEMSGVDLGDVIRKEMNDNITQIIYISSHTSHAMELFHIRPYDFILKPFKQEQVDKVMRGVIELINLGQQKFAFTTGRAKELTRIPYANILYFQSFRRKVIIHTTDDTYEFYGKLDDVYKIVSQFRFLYIHKSFIINYEHVTRMGYESVQLSDGTNLTISEKKRKEVRSKCMNFENIMHG